MEQEGDIFRQFKTLDPQQISSLSSVEMKNWLLALHREGQNRKQVKSADDNNKSKHIRKNYNRRGFKQHIRQRITSIVSCTLLRLKNQQEKQELGLQRSHGAKEGKSKFKSTSQLQPTHKHSHFNKHLSLALGKLTTEELSCSICLEMFVRPAQTACGHTFCYQCIDQSMLFSHNCPNCRQNIRGCEPIVCSVLDRLISYKMSRCSQQAEKVHYMTRVRKFQKWWRERMVKGDDLRKGMPIDCRDTESIWCQALVLDIYQKYDKEKGRKAPVSVLVHYNRWHTIYNEIIDLPSNRIAPIRYFSMRTDIPHYNLAEAEGNVRGSVITGANRIEAPPSVHFIRIEESNDNQEQMSDSAFSELVQLEQEDQLRELGPNDENYFEDDDEDISDQGQEEGDQPHHMTITDYVNQMRRNALRRLNPNPLINGQTIEIQDSAPEPNMAQLFQDAFDEQSQQDYIPVPEAIQQPQSVEYFPVIDSLQLYQQQYISLFKDSSSQQGHMLNLQEPSNPQQNPLQEYD